MCWRLGCRRKTCVTLILGMPGGSATTVILKLKYGDFLTLSLIGTGTLQGMSSDKSSKFRILYSPRGTMPAHKRKSEVVYLSGTSEALGPGWDVMKVVFRQVDGQQQMRPAGSVVIARNLGGKIMRRTDNLLDHWEEVKDGEILHTFQHYFAERKRLRLESPRAKANGSVSKRMRNDSGNIEGRELQVNEARPQESRGERGFPGGGSGRGGRGR